MNVATGLPQTNVEEPQITCGGQLVLSGLVTLVVFLLAMNWYLPWEGDQPAKAAQIIEIAQSNDFFLSESLVEYYKIRLFSFYYFASALLYKAIGGDIFAFMNLTSVAMGVTFVVALANSNWRLFRIRPLWTTFVLLAMPAVVSTFTYGNEVAWSLSLLTVSVMLATYRQPALYYASGPIFAMAVYCRADLVLVVPFWLVWVTWVVRPGEAGAIQRLVRMCLSAGCAGALLWLLLLRTIPVTNSDIRWADSIKFVVAMLVYPFNPSVILLVIPGWLWFKKYHALAAWSLLLLFLQLAYYIGVLASPKYIMPLLLGYGLVVPFLIDRLSIKGRCVIVSLIGVWFFFALSIYGVFGPVAGGRWYLPTVDGPCPTGAYLSFYKNARNGRYQVKQQESLDITRLLFEYLEDHPEAPTVYGYKPLPSLGFIAEQLGTPIPDQVIREVDPTAKVHLMLRPGYFNVARLNEERRKEYDAWLEQGRVRGVGSDASSALPTIVEIGSDIPEGENNALAKRILLMNDRYQGHMVHEIPEFIPEYRSITWIESNQVPQNSKLIYQDEEFSAVEQEVEGGQTFGFVWPAIYYGQRHPRDY